jgi:hypothetical protein
MLEREGRILLWIRQTCGDFDGQILYMAQLRFHFIHGHGHERCTAANASSLKHAGKRLLQNPQRLGLPSWLRPPSIDTGLQPSRPKESDKIEVVAVLTYFCSQDHDVIRKNITPAYLDEFSISSLGPKSTFLSGFRTFHC